MVTPIVDQMYHAVTVTGDPSVRRIVAEDGRSIGFCEVEYAALLCAAPALADAAYTALRAMEAMFPRAIPTELGSTYNRLHDALKAAEKGETRI